MATHPLELRARPDGRPVMCQRWENLLFLHWTFPVAQLRALLPPGLELDTFNGRGWVGVTPFRLSRARPPFLPALPVLGDTLELNVRTYVKREGTPGIWFFSLDASNPLAVAGARLAWHLPYFQASMTMEDGAPAASEASIRWPMAPRRRFTSRRWRQGGRAARFDVAWRAGSPVAAPEPGSLEFFLIERYALYAAWRGRLYLGRIHHDPWTLREVQVESYTSSMIAAQGLPEPLLPPLAHAQRDPLEVEIWPLRKLQDDADINPSREP